MKRDEEEIRLTCEELPQQPDNDIIMRVKAMQTAAVLVYRAAAIDGRRMASLRCTECGCESFAEWVPKDEMEGCTPYSSRPGFKTNRVYKSGDTCECPVCGQTARAVHVSDFGGDEYAVERTWFATAHNVRGHFVLLTWSLDQCCDKRARVCYEAIRRDGIAIVGGAPVSFTCRQSVGFGGYTYLKKWKPLKKFKCLSGGWSSAEIIGFDKSVLVGTECENSAFEVLLGHKGELPLSQYLRLWAKYPAVENLMRSGFGAYVIAALNRCTYIGGSYFSRDPVFSTDSIKKYIDIKKVKPHEMLRVEKCDAGLARAFDDIDKFRLYAVVWNRCGAKLSADMLGKIGRRLRAVPLAALIESQFSEKNGVSAVRIINYLLKQSKKDERIDCRYLDDYWSMASRVYDEIPEELVFPRDLIKAHDDMSVRAAEKQNAGLSEKIAAVSKKKEWLSFEDAEKGLLIRPCRSYGELYAEGEKLHHCVATYAKQCAEGSTFIFFIRRTAQPDTPYYTLELKGERVVQNRGLHNCDRTQEIKSFEAEWLEHIKQIQEVKNGKRDSGKKKCEYAGA